MKVEWVPLGEVLTPRPSQPVRPERTYRIAGVYGFARGVLLRQPIAGSETQYRSMTRLCAGDVVYSKLKAFEGAVAVAGPAADGYFLSPEFPVFTITGAVDSRYLRHWLASRPFLSELARRSVGLGARRERVHPEQFLLLPVPLPTPVEQERVAGRLGLIEGRMRLSTEFQAGDTLQLLIQQLVSSAPIASVGNLVQRDRDWIEIETRERYEPVGVRGFGRGIIHYPGTPGSELAKLRYYRLRPDRLLVSNIKAWEGAVCVTNESDDGRVASNRFLQYRSRGERDIIGWLHRYLLTPEGIHQLGEASPGSADRNRTLSMDAFEAIEVPLPDERQRARIVRVAQQVDRIRALATKRDQLRDAILPAARNQIFEAMR